VERAFQRLIGSKDGSKYNERRRSAGKKSLFGSCSAGQERKERASGGGEVGSTRVEFHSQVKRKLRRNRVKARVGQSDQGYDSDCEREGGDTRLVY